MAKQASLLRFTGKIGDLIGYCREGEYFTRSVPGKVRQTPGTKRAAYNFGIASRKGRLVRNAFAADLNVHCDSSAGNRLNGMFVKAGRNNPAALAGFKFNKHTSVDRFFTLTPLLSEDGKLHIPAQQLRKLKGISRLEVKLIASRIDFTTRRVTGTDADMVMIDLERPFEGADLSVDAAGEGFLLVALQVRGFLGDYASSDRKFLAADIIAVIEPDKQTMHHSPALIRNLEWERKLRAGVRPLPGVDRSFIQRE